MIKCYTAAIPSIFKATMMAQDHALGGEARAKEYVDLFENQHTAVSAVSMQFV